MASKVIMSFSMSFQPCQGRYLRVYNQAATLVKEGYEVTLLAWDREAKWPLNEERDGVQIRRFAIRAGVAQGPHKNAFNLARFNGAVLRYLLSHEFDVTHCYNLDTIATTLLAARLKRRRCILDLCEPEYYAFWDKPFTPLLKIVNFLETSLARHYDHVLVHNLYQIDKFRSHGVRRVTQIGSYPNRYMAPEGDRSGERPFDPVVVIGRIGTIYENNGIEELVAAFRRLLERQKQHSSGVRYRLFLAGRVYESYQPVLDRLIEPIREHVERHGPFQSTELHKMYERVNIAIIFTRKTQWFQNITPTKLFDAMASGVPVIGNDIGEVRQIVEEGPCGVIVDESDPDSVCDGIERLAHDPDLRRRMGDTARRLAKEKYTWEAYRDAFVSVYRSLISH